MSTGFVVDLAGMLPAVWNLQADYARHIDGRDAVAWSRLFGEGGALVVGDREISGPAALEAFAFQSAVGVHTQGVPRVEQADVVIRATSSFLFMNADTKALIAGEYRDEIREVGGSMVFARREIHVRARS